MVAARAANDTATLTCWRRDSDALDAAIGRTRSLSARECLDESILS